MAKWKRLIVAREQNYLSQLEAAERVNVGLVTYQRWEAGKARPQPHHMRRLHEVFGAVLEEVNIALVDEAPIHTTASDIPPHTLVTSDSSEERLTAASVEEIDEPQAFIATNMTTHLWSLAFKEHSTYSNKRETIKQAIKEFDRMNSSNKNYQITRREALCSLATLPMITLGLTTSGRTVQPTQSGSVVAHCAASLEACWELYRNGDASDTLLAFKSVSKYVPALQTIARDSSQYRNEALDLAARYALLKTLLGWICVGPRETIQYAKDAVALSKETGDISLQLSAYSKLAWAYFYDRQYMFALATAQRAQALLQHYDRLPNSQPMHPIVQAGTYSTLALMQSTNRQSPDASLGKVLEADPGDESYVLMTSKRSTLLLEAAWTYYYYGDPANAMTMLAQRVDPETLAPKIPQSEMGRVETINIMALSSLKTKSRDMGQTIHFWVAGIEGAKALQNEQRFNEAVTGYELMEVVYPGEQRIADLRGLIIHW